MDKFVRKSSGQSVSIVKNQTQEIKKNKISNEVNTSENEIVNEYIKYLPPKEFNAYLIAKTHLGSSFNILKSNGFLQWIEKNKNAK